jgi:Zn finger protein HypA/HybF involved in hydrogenase expression
MARKIDPKFFECLDCEKVTLLATTTPESTCPGCGSANGRVISSSELERRIEEGAVFSIDLSPGRPDQPKRQSET